MSIIFYWADKETSGFDYGTGLNLSWKYNVRYFDKKIYISVNKDYIEGFWGNSINSISVFAGENGAGKSTVAKQIGNAISLSATPREERSANNKNHYLLVCDECDKFAILTNTVITISDVVFQDDIIRKKLSISDTCCEKYYTAFFNQSLSYKDYIYSDNVFFADMTMSGKIKAAYEEYLGQKYIGLETRELRTYLISEQDRIISLILKQFDTDTYVKSIDGGIYVKQVKLQLDNPECYLSDLLSRRYKKTDKTCEIIKLFKRIYDRERDKIDFKTIFAWCILANLIIDGVIKQIVPEHYKDENEDVICEYLRKMDRQISSRSANPLFSKAVRAINYLGKRCNLDMGDYLIAIEKLKKCPNSSNGDLVINVENEYRYLCKIYEIYKMVRFAFPFLQFDYGISDGEYHFLRLYSDLNEAYEKVNKHDKYKNGNCFLIFDEPDMGLHVRWQRSFVNWLVGVVNKLFKDYRVQIIITTHSPIILSDIPGICVAYMEKLSLNPINNKTFACNIHGLFLDSFFLSDSGIIGEFAQRKINDYSKNGKISELLPIIGDQFLVDQISISENGQKLNSNQRQNEPLHINKRIASLIREHKNELDKLLQELE